MYIECDMLRFFRAKENEKGSIYLQKNVEDTYCHSILASTAMQ